MGELNQPWEEVPGGPFDLSAELIPCGGLVVRGVLFALDDAEPESPVLPGIVFDFKAADGSALPPILLALADDELLALADLVRDAVRGTRRAARQTNQQRKKD